MPLNGILSPKQVNKLVDYRRRQADLSMPVKHTPNNMKIKGLPDALSLYRFAVINVQLQARTPNELPAVCLLCQTVVNNSGPYLAVIEYINAQPDFINLADWLLSKASTQLHFDKLFAVGCYENFEPIWSQAANEKAELMRLTGWYAPELVPIVGTVASFENQPFGQRQLLLNGPMDSDRICYDEQFADSQQCMTLSGNLSINQLASDGTPVGCVTADTLLAAYQIAEVERRNHGLGINSND